MCCRGGLIRFCAHDGQRTERPLAAHVVGAISVGYLFALGRVIGAVCSIVRVADGHVDGNFVGVGADVCGRRNYRAASFRLKRGLVIRADIIRGDSWGNALRFN